MTGELQQSSLSAFDTVGEYSVLGDHRTGSAVDRLTTEWFAERLAALGGRVRSHRYEFERWHPECSVTADGDDVEALPLWYHGPDGASDGPVRVEPLSVEYGARLLGLGAARTGCLDEGAALLICPTLGGADGDLIAVNQAPKAADRRPPVICVPGRLAEHSADRQWSARLFVERSTGSSTNVIADFGPPGGPRLVITTPLTGWFRCAGERGTGIAVLLDVVGHLPSSEPVTVVGTTGHEIDGAGLRAALETGSIPDGPILHLGASLAAVGTDGTTLTESWWCRSSATGSSFERIRRAANALGRDVEFASSGPTAEPETWIGEAALWCPRSDLMCSIAGTFPRFHSPSDLPATSTSPALLRDAIELERQVAGILIAAIHRRPG